MGRYHRTSRLVCLALLGLFLAGCHCVQCKHRKVQRYGSVVGIKPEKIEYYKQLHANAWPAVKRSIKECNMQNFSIYLTQFDDGNYYLFSYLEYTGDDIKKDGEKAAALPENQRWWKETSPCQIPLKNRPVDAEIWKPMEEVFHLD